jgi:hypothetical protein
MKLHPMFSGQSRPAQGVADPAGWKPHPGHADAAEGIAIGPAEARSSRQLAPPDGSRVYLANSADLV